MKKLITIIGPTAIGKTALSIEVAKTFDCDIISCDSRQFYKELAIGTAVPSTEELNAAKHHFIQNRSIFDDYSVGDYEQDAIALLDELFKKSEVEILIGGSGLYVDAVLKGFDDFPDIPSDIRHELLEQLAEKGIEHLQQKLKTLDIDYYNQVDLSNSQRLIRALEVCIHTGQAYSSFRLNKGKKRDFEAIKIGLNTDREILYNRINQRVDLMMDMGLLDEAQKVCPHKELNSLQTVGYRELFKYFDGEWTLDFAVSEIKKNTRRFAKRQLTWFRKDTEIEWFEPSDIEGIIKYLKAKII